jgi:DNA ligase-1
VEYADLAATYRRLEETDSTDEKTAVLAALLADADDEHLGMLATLARGKVYAAHENLDLGVSSSLTTEAILKATGVDADEFEAVRREAGDLGDAAAWAVENQRQQTLLAPELDVRTVYETLRAAAGFEGAGSQGRRVDAVAELVSRGDPQEARYAVRTALGYLRIGVGEGTIRDAIAEAFLDGSQAAVDSVERAYQVTSDYRTVARTARDGGREALDALEVELGRPVAMMLAKDGDDLEADLAELAGEDGRALVETKYDGARVQLHIDDGEVRLFTRRLEEVTEQFPEVVAAVGEAIEADRALLDGELVGYDPETGEPVPFQTFSRRIRRESDIERLAEEVPATVHLFDCLLDGESLLEAPLCERIDRLEALFDPEPGAVERAENRWTGDPETARAFYEAALAAGHEGLVIKNPEAAYQPGRRVGRMLKQKPTMEPLDLVVSRAQRSDGRRSDYLGRLFLACYDAENDAYREVGRLSTGYTDEELAELTERLERLVVGETDGDGVLELRPELVLEIEYEEIQRSPEYGSGYALRFPRFLGVREELGPTDADRLERVEELFEGQ